MLAEFQKQLNDTTDVAVINAITRVPVMTAEEVKTFFDAMKSKLQKHLNETGQSTYSLIFASRLGDNHWDDELRKKENERYSKVIVNSLANWWQTTGNICSHYYNTLKLSDKALEMASERRDVFFLEYISTWLRFGG